MSCLSCDGSGSIPPPNDKPWVLTGDQPMACPVCCGPHVKWLVKRLASEDEVLVCSHEPCNAEIDLGWLVYAQLTTSELPALDEALSLCCDKHREIEANRIRADGHPTTCLPFSLADARGLI